jgi:hypothetical protein
MKTLLHPVIKAWLVLLGIALFAACAPAKPTPLPVPTGPPLPTSTPTPTPYPYLGEEILSIGTANMETVTTMKYMMTNSAKGSGFGAVADGKGRYQNPEQFYLQLNYGGDAVEILSLSPNAYYWRLPGGPPWESTTQAEVNKLYSVSSPSELLKLGGMAQNIQKLDNEQVDGVNCYHIRFDLDMAKYIQMIGYSTLGPINLNHATGVVQIWAGVEDMYFRQTRIELVSTDSGDDASIKEKWVFYDFNKPVDIPLP